MQGPGLLQLANSCIWQTHVTLYADFTCRRPQYLEIPVTSRGEGLSARNFREEDPAAWSGPRPLAVGSPSSAKTTMVPRKRRRLRTSRLRGKPRILNLLQGSQRKMPYSGLGPTFVSKFDPNRDRLQFGRE